MCLKDRNSKINVRTVHRVIGKDPSCYVWVFQVEIFDLFVACCFVHSGAAFVSVGECGFLNKRRIFCFALIVL